MIYITGKIIAKCLENLEYKHSETICLELTVSKKKWHITFAHRPPSRQSSSMNLYFLESNYKLT